jgi:pimeloyl-ACP methyl ester carboxylesterase
MNTVKKVKKRNFLSRIGRIVAGILIVLAMLIGIIFAGGAIVRAQVKANYPPPGQLVDVGGYKLHIHCKGEGSPTVVVLAGSGIPSTYYWLIQNETSKNTRVCIYDRAGYAWSEEGEGDLSPVGQVEDLKVLLANARIEPPYILAGHSYGGYIARLYAQTNPDEVASLVMIDSAHEDQWTSFPQSIQDMAQQMYAGPNKPVNLFLMSFLRSLQAILPIHDPMADYFPPDIAKTLTALRKLYPLNIYTIKAEVSDMVFGKSPRISDLGDLPIVVITHGVPVTMAGQSKEENAGFEQVNLEMQTRLLSLSTNVRQVIAKESNHDEIPVKQADLVNGAIRDMLVQLAATR